MNILDGIRNIIFDFGGVVINLDYQATIDKFRTLGIPDFEEFYNLHKHEYWLDHFDTGRVNGAQFIEGIRKYLPASVSDEQVAGAWNLMLRDFPPERLELLKKLKSEFRTFLLSNTNDIHIQYYTALVKEWYGIENLDVLFEKAYYSYQLGMRKPDAGIFLHVLRENGLEARETLFIDDTPEHIESAANCGIRAYLLQKPETIIDLFGMAGSPDMTR